MTKKNVAVMAQNENVNEVKNVALEAQNVAEENPQRDDLMSKAEKAKLEAKNLMDQAKKAAAEAKKAAKEAREAAKKAKAFSARPMRKSSFEVRVCDTMDDVANGGEFVSSSDVHYCAEKVAIDAIAALRDSETPSNLKKVYLINKISKERDENDEPKSRVLVSMVYLDEETMRTVID